MDQPKKRPFISLKGMETGRVTSAGKPVYRYKGEDISEKSIDIEADGKTYVIPTVIDGKLYTEDAAVAKFFNKEVEPIKVLKENIQENFPSNWMQGRVSDYHTKNGTTPRDEYDKTNFNPKHSGQDDLEDEELEESGKDKSEKNYKAWKSSRIKKEIVRKLREWGSNLDNSYILDKDSILKGTPEDKDAIKREDIVDQAFNKAKVVDEACWKGYKQVGGKIKNGKKVPNCVPESVDNEIDETAKRDYKAEYKKFQSSTKSKKYRAELNKYNRDKGTYGNGDGKDASHKGGKIVGFESESKNRGRAEKSRLKKK